MTAPREGSFPWDRAASVLRSNIEVNKHTRKKARRELRNVRKGGGLSILLGLLLLGLLSGSKSVL